MVKTQNLLDVETHEVWLNLTTRHFLKAFYLCWGWSDKLISSDWQIIL